MYQQKFGEVLDYVKSNLDKPITTLELSNIAGFSQYHFHRLFVAHFNMSVGQYVKLSRFKQATYQLAFRHNMSLLDITISCGYENAASFSREFKNISGMTPSGFRKKADWTLCNTITQTLDFQHGYSDSQSKGNHMHAIPISRSVNIVHFPETRVACLEHRGAPNKVMETVGKFIQWRKQFGPSPKHSDTYNILYDDPAMVAPCEYRFDVCASLNGDLKPNSCGVIEKVIPSGRCAVLIHHGSDSILGQSIHYMYSDWLAQSQESLRDYPCFIKRLTFYPDVPEHEAALELYLPIN